MVVYHKKDRVRHVCHSGQRVLVGNIDSPSFRAWITARCKPGLIDRSPRNHHFHMRMTVAQHLAYLRSDYAIAADDQDRRRCHEQPDPLCFLREG
jgi:hypothetical protein